MEGTTNQSDVTKESYLGSEHDNGECCMAVGINTLGDEIDVNSVGRALIESEGPANLEPYVGMEFEFEEDTKIFYNDYARRVGFSIRVNMRRRSKRDGTNICLVYVCSKEGFRQKKYKSNRPHTREGCMAMVIVKKGNSGKWFITKFVKDHNHTLVTPKDVSLLRSHKCVFDSMKNLTNTFNGTRAHRAQFSESCNIDYTLRERTNYIQSVRKRILGRDAQCVLEYFKHMQAKNPSFFYAVQVDEEYHMTNFFWADPRSRMAYNCFRDVVTFDTTYRTNHYAMPFAPFIGVNHHKQPILFGCALLLDETETSFVWLFNTWLEAMSGLHPISLLTDQDPAIEAAITRVFPRIRHRFCKWHILRKFPEKLGHVEHKHVNLKEEFFKCINMIETNEDFESCWWSFIDKYQLRENEWLQLLFQTREQWVQMYSQDTLFASMRTTQQSESINPFFYGYVNEHTTLQEFVTQCDKAIDNQYEKELEEDFKTSYMKRFMKMGLPMENQAAEIYTRTIFLKFQEELFESLRYIAEITEEDGPISTFRVVEFGEEKREYTITFNVAEVKASCSCQLFECAGVLCRHILKVFIVKNVMILPSHYILKCWTRNATSGIGLEEHSVEIPSDCQESRTSRYNDLCNQAIKYAAEGATTIDTYNVAKRALRMSLEEVLDTKKNVGIIIKPSKMFKR